MTNSVGIQLAAGSAATTKVWTYPVVLDLCNRRVLVVGAGRVAARKITGLLDAGAQVTVVAPELAATVEALAGRGELAVHRRRYAPGDIGCHRLVITATGDPDVDRVVAADADAAGVWVNSADDPANCSFILPAVHRDGPVSVAVSTSGTSPALASWLRDHIAERLDGVGELAGLLGAARARVKASGRSTETLDWRGLLDGLRVSKLRDGRRVDARRLIDELVDGSTDPDATGVSGSAGLRCPS